MTSAATQDPRVARSKAAVLDTAAALLVEGGLGALTIEGVVARCGVAKTTVYRHWSSRDDLVVDTYIHVSPHLVRPDESRDFEHQLREVIGQLVDVFTSPRWASIYPGLLEAARHSASIRSLRQRMDEHQQEIVDDVLRVGVDEGRLPDDLNIEEARLQLLGPLAMAVIVRPEVIDRQLGERFVDLFLASRCTG